MASTYLTRTTGTASLNTKMTFSTWIKRSSISSSVAFFSFSTDGSNELYFRFQDNDALQVFSQKSGSTIIVRKTNRVFRDVSAWYHLVLQIDTTQVTASNRIKIYVNGVQETSFSAETNPNQNETINYVSNATFEIGRKTTSSNLYMDGSMSHIHFIDGIAYDATAFGEYDANGVWKIKTSPSVTYGTNGFFILKDGNSVTDQSGNGNNFTVGAGTLTKTEDSPSNVFATMNPLDNFYQSATFSKGNNTIVTSDTAYAATMSTLGMTSGKYYAEMKATNIYNGYSQFGIRGTFVTANSQGAGQGTDGYAYIANGGQKRNNDSSSAYGTTWNSGDIIGCAVDLDNNYIYWSRNGTWQNSGDPTSGASGTGAAFSLGTPSSGAYFFAASDNDADAGTANTFDFNFGNGYFGTTAVASAGTNASGNGIFEYDVPTGFTALSTKGLNL